jgi:hypothetical protein
MLKTANLRHTAATVLQDLASHWRYLATRTDGKSTYEEQLTKSIEPLFAHMKSVVSILVPKEARIYTSKSSIMVALKQNERS